MEEADPRRLGVPRAERFRSGQSLPWGTPLAQVQVRGAELGLKGKRLLELRDHLRKVPRTRAEAAVQVRVSSVFGFTPSNLGVRAPP